MGLQSACPSCMSDPCTLTLQVARPLADSTTHLPIVLHAVVWHLLAEFPLKDLQFGPFAASLLSDFKFSSPQQSDTMEALKQLLQQALDAAM